MTQHDWPDGKYIKVNTPCKECGALNYMQPKYAPPLCFHCYEGGMATLLKIREARILGLTAEYGPYIPRPKII